MFLFVCFLFSLKKNIYNSCQHWYATSRKDCWRNNPNTHEILALKSLYLSSYATWVALWAFLKFFPCNIHISNPVIYLCTGWDFRIADSHTPDPLLPAQFGQFLYLSEYSYPSSVFSLCHLFETHCSVFTGKGFDHFGKFLCFLSLGRPWFLLMCTFL